MVILNFYTLLFTTAVLGFLFTGCRGSGSILTRKQAEHTLSFAGYEWQIKHRTERAGPGNNFFSASPENVWVDMQGRLHLKINYRHGQWHCAEIISQKSFGYGTYQFNVAPLKAPLNKNVVIGLFLWNSYAKKQHNHEVDIEFSRWGEEQNLNAQYVVHPDVAGNKHRFNFDLQAATSRHSFFWTTDSIGFWSDFQNSSGPQFRGKSSMEWQWSGEEGPRAGREKVHLNVWLYRGQPPTENQEVEVVFTDFTFTPLQARNK
jgi:hypothetical protein